MLDRQFIRQNPDIVRAGAVRKGVQAPVDEFLALDKTWREATHEWETVQAQMNQASKSIGAYLAQGKKAEAEAAKAEAATLKGDISNLEAKAKDLETELRALELKFPNLPHESVPDGATADDNPIIREWGEKPESDGPAKAHFDIAAELGLIDFERASSTAAWRTSTSTWRTSPPG